MGKAKENPGDFSFKPFKELKEIIDKKGIKLSNKRTTSKDEDLSDEELFALAMSQVQEIKEYRMLKIGDKKPYQTAGRIDPDEEIINALSEIVQGRRRINLRDTSEFVEWVNPHYAAIYRKDIVRRLHEGKFSVQDVLDMHGLTLDEAEAEVDNFIKNSMIKGFRCIKFIHGRGLRSPSGEAVLKEALIKWLMGRYHKHIIAFATALHNDGGLGAVYVLLRKRQAR